MQKIYEFFIISIFFLLSVASAYGQQQKKDSTAFKFKSLRIETDLVSIASGISETGYRPNFEGGLYVDINKKYMPAFEFGFAGKTKTGATGIQFSGSGIYTRVGVDFNLMKNKGTKSAYSNLFYAGVRLGYSPFSYNYKNISVTDAYWNQTVSQDIENIKTSRTWLELVAGVRVEIAKNIFMGWSVRNKKLFGTDLPGELSPYYIPCFGVKGDGKAWGVNYSVGYRF